MSTTSTTDQVIAHVRAERERLADLFAGLAPEQWDAATLCTGWRVRELVAHMTMPYRVRTVSVLGGIVRAGFSFNRYADRDARETARRMDPAQLVELMRSNLDNPWTPPGGGPVGALSHDVIHGLDATEALGLPGAPPERIGLVLGATEAKKTKYFGVDLRGLRLTATDVDASVGDGEEVVAMTARELLLVVTGRVPLSGVRG